jgi:hypothetical protein
MKLPWTMRSQRLRVLITNFAMTIPGGTQSVTRDLARKLMASAHDVVVYSPLLGAAGEELRKSGIMVVDDLCSVTEPPDVIHGQHSVPTVEAVIRFPHVPVISVCHAWLADIEAPVALPQVQYYVGVDEACVDRIRHTVGVDPDRIRLVPNAIALERIPKRKRALPAKPAKAVAFGKAAKLVPMLEKICADRGMELRVIGGTPERLISNPEAMLVDFDLVFASARAALESICAGCAVVVCDGRGVAGMASEANLEMLRMRNFGLRTLTMPSTPGVINAEIDRYDPVAAEALSVRVRREADFDHQYERYLKFYRRAIQGLSRHPVSAEQHARAVSAFLRNVLPRTTSPTLSMESIGRDVTVKLISLMKENASLKKSLAAVQPDSGAS